MRRAFVTAIGLLLWCPPGWTQRPSDADIAALIERSRAKALDYARALPDFVCTELIRRYAPFESQLGHVWRHADTLTVRLSYFQQKEEHKLVAIDDKPSDRKYEELTGVTGMGEFGGTLLTIFRPASETSFLWQGWKTVRGRKAAVYTYVVDVAHSRYKLSNGVVGHTHQALVGFRGDLEVDSATGEVLQFTHLPDQIPKELDLFYTRTTVDYDFADVGGRDYLLPARSETEMRGRLVAARSVTEFREYHKFAADSTVDFGPPK
jgi:hypothetical protein